jgi:hypothetical protein
MKPPGRRGLPRSINTYEAELASKIAADPAAFRQILEPVESVVREMWANGLATETLSQVESGEDQVKASIVRAKFGAANMAIDLHVIRLAQRELTPYCETWALPVSNTTRWRYFNSMCVTGAQADLVTYGLCTLKAALSATLLQAPFQDLADATLISLVDLQKGNSSARRLNFRTVCDSKMQIYGSNLVDITGPYLTVRYLIDQGILPRHCLGRYGDGFHQVAKRLAHADRTTLKAFMTHFGLNHREDFEHDGRKAAGVFWRPTPDTQPMAELGSFRTPWNGTEAFAVKTGRRRALAAPTFGRTPSGQRCPATSARLPGDANPLIDHFADFVMRIYPYPGLTLDGLAPSSNFPRQGASIIYPQTAKPAQQLSLVP